MTTVVQVDMVSGFPPTTDRTDEIARMVEMIRAVIDDRAVYLSSPITTGRRHLEWLRASKTGRATENGPRDILEGNTRDASRLAAELRRTFRFVIDPSSLKPGASWTQSDFRVLWATVIRQLASLVIVQNAWEYSRGCAFEFLTAHQAKIPVLDRELRLVSVPQGISRLEAALEEMQRCGSSIEFVELVLVELRKLVSKQRGTGT